MVIATRLSYNFFCLRFRCIIVRTLKFEVRKTTLKIAVQCTHVFFNFVLIVGILYYNNICNPETQSASEIWINVSLIFGRIYISKDFSWRTKITKMSTTTNMQIVFWNYTPTEKGRDPILLTVRTYIFIIISLLPRSMRKSGMPVHILIIMQ